MSKKILIFLAAVVAILTVAFIAVREPHQKQEVVFESKEKAREKLSRIKVALLYQNINDGLLIDRSIDETIEILRKTHTELIFRGFWKWSPVVNSPNNIPSKLLELVPDRNRSPEQIAESLRKSGHYYQALEKWISAIKKEMPNVIFVGAIPAQTLSRIEYNPITNKVYSAQETWAMALDPQKWKITRGRRPVTKEEFQRWFYRIHPYGGKLEGGYDWRKAPAYFPDITNPDFQQLLLSWAKRQIDAGADAIWIDMLYHQAARLAEITGNVNHPAVKESIEAASHVVNEIHKYGYSKGKYIYVGSWSGPFVEAKIHRNSQFSYSPADLDFITVSPTSKEILAKRLDEPKWKYLLSAIRKTYGNVPIFAFVDWSFDESPMVVFSQKLSKEEQKEVIKVFDESFAKMGVNFIYPVHGGYLGAGKITTKLAFGRYRFYDSLAPEFDTYDAIRELARDKFRSE